MLIVYLEWGRDRLIEHDEFMAQHFNLAALHAVVGRALRPKTHQAFDLHAVLIAHVFSYLEHLCTVRVTHHLALAFAVTQVDEDHSAMVTPTVHPATQLDVLAVEGLGHQTTVMGAHSHF